MAVRDPRYPKAEPSSQAYQAAMKRLRAAHEEEYAAYHAEERVKRGLPPEVVPSRTKYDFLRSENERLKALLEQAGIDAA